MIVVNYVLELPYPVVCYGCGKKSDEYGVRIEVKNPTRIKGEVIYLCSDCRRELYEKI